MRQRWARSCAVPSWVAGAREWLRPWHPVGARVQPWEAVVARRRNAPGKRHPLTYQTILDQFAVESNPRYRKNRAEHDETYCNIFVWDVTRAMRAELPHWIDPEGEPAPVHVGRETTANGVIEWLRVHGGRFGWQETAAAHAQRSADRGCPVVAAWHNPGGIGHVAMVRPGFADERGPLLAQSGERNARMIRAAEAFGTAWRTGAVTYFVHD